MAVAIKKLGFTNIKIYNGGIKDWGKSGFRLESKNSLPELNVQVITTEDFFEMLQKFEKRQCRDNEGKHALTILDLRNANHMSEESPLPRISTSCPIQTCKLDDLQSPKMRDKLPKTGPIITITETGNRDEFAIRYLAKYGFNTIQGLKFGMRGWLKQRYPTQ